MGRYRHLSLNHDEDGLLWLTLDVAGKSTNVLGAEVLEELGRAAEAIAASGAKGLIVRSAKPGGFVAGADITAFRGLHDEAEALALIRQGQAIFDRYQNLPMPTLAMIHGYCLGGGLEWALACDYRIALDDPKTRLGLPEVKLGIHPGFGGSVRAIRLIGAPAAMDLMLTGRRVDARRAKALGLVDEALPERVWRDAAVAIVARRPAKHRPAAPLRWLDGPALRPWLAKWLRRQVAKRPAPSITPRRLR